MARTESIGAYIDRLPPIDQRVKKILVSGGQFRADVTREGILIPRHFTAPVPSSAVNVVSYEMVTSYLNHYEFKTPDEKVQAFLDFVGACI